LGIPLSHLAWDGPEAQLNDTINTQPALLVHSVAVLRVVQELYPDFRPALVAGHSMGELSALVAAGALSFLEALKLVRRRGELMKQAGDASPGGMAAVIGLDIPTLEEICQQASREDEIVQVANDNCPGQVVISGNTDALERAMMMATETKALKVVRLAISIAAHSPMMTHAQAEFNRAVDQAPISDPDIPMVGNVTATPLRDAAAIRADLKAQLTSRVRWTETIQHMLDQGIDTFIELGSGEVLTGLIKRINRKARRITLGKPGDFDQLTGDR
jgi:[acyl-carrier-protein] S-malonyltransferase